ncbi:hypothetical protein KAI04_04130 [Candidatus Pacearchaeota archaeon]|nr:hypothetical protein [Candidatus Pacearchaeota archaeon]
MKQCNICLDVWISYSIKCIHCGSKDINSNISEEEFDRIMESQGRYKIRKK